MIEQTAIIGVIVALVQVLKGAGLPSQFAPVIAIIFGLAASVAFAGVSPETVFAGLVYGLSASGVYSGSKTTAEAFLK